MPRACRCSHIARAPFAPLGSGAHSAPALVGWLLANAMRVRLVLPRQKTAGQRTLRQLKKSCVRYAAINTEKQAVRHAEPLVFSTLKLKPMGRAWCGHARPTITIAPAKFYRFKEQKKKIFKERKVV
ncbi:hypothetical protein D4R78_04065 [bacterium]|nr:MAG: hypothetical protein D4R78_04065 [bacterium]